MAHHGTHADNALLYANSPAPSRSASPKFNIADFEQLQLPTSALTTATRETSYASQAAIDDLDFARSSSSNTPVANRYSRSIKTSFLRRSASKLLPRAITTTNLPATHSAPQPASGASSPTKSLSSFITGNSSAISSSTSKASVRAKTASKVLFDSYFNGNSNDVHIGVLQPHSRSSSAASRSASPREDGYEPDCETMATSSYTRSPVRTRPRRSPTTDSTTSTYAGKLGSWLAGNNKQSSPRAQISVTSRIVQDDPLVSLDMQQALFPYGPVDPLNPTSFNDLLTAAEAVITTYQNAYRQRVAELATIKSEFALKDDEFEESETRAQHLKMQLQDLGEQCTAQTQKAELLEGMLRERDQPPSSDCGCEARSDVGRRESRVRSGQAGGSDSGFESDGDSVFSAHTPEQQDEGLRTKGHEYVDPQSHDVPLPMSTQPMYSTDVRRENEMLRMRVAELESAVDGCLALISNPLA